MSVSQHRGAWEVRWRDGSGTRRGKRFPSEEAARAYDEALREVSPAARRSDTRRGGSGVYSYATRDGTRWRFVVRRSDGSQTSKRRFSSQRAAAEARRRLIEQVERREAVHTAETFGHYWERWLARRQPYLEEGPGAAMRSTAASGCCPPSPISASGHCRWTTSAPSPPTRPRRWRPATSRPRRSTTRSSRSRSA